MYKLAAASLTMLYQHILMMLYQHILMMLYQHILMMLYQLCLAQELFMNTHRRHWLSLLTNKRIIIHIDVTYVIASRTHKPYTS